MPYCVAVLWQVFHNRAGEADHCSLAKVQPPKTVACTLSLCPPGLRDTPPACLARGVELDQSPMQIKDYMKKIFSLTLSGLRDTPPAVPPRENRDCFLTPAPPQLEEREQRGKRGEQGREAGAWGQQGEGSEAGWAPAEGRSWSAELANRTPSPPPAASR